MNLVGMPGKYPAGIALDSAQKFRLKKVIIIGVAEEADGSDSDPVLWVSDMTWKERMWLIAELQAQSLGERIQEDV